MDDVAARPPVDRLEVQQIMQFIPHRYPFLMIDRILNVVPGEGCIGIKNVSINEPQFQGHFPAHAVMPGVLIIESMAQTAAVLVVYTLGPEMEGKLVYFMSIDSARFRRPVVPGDTMHIHVGKIHRRANVWKFKGEVKVDGKVVAEAVYSAMILTDS